MFMFQRPHTILPLCPQSLTNRLRISFLSLMPIMHIHRRLSVASSFLDWRICLFFLHHSQRNRGQVFIATISSPLELYNLASAGRVLECENDWEGNYE